MFTYASFFGDTLAVVDKERFDIVEKPSYRQRRLQQEKELVKEMIAHHESEIVEKKKRLKEIDEQLK